VIMGEGFDSSKLLILSLNIYRFSNFMNRPTVRLS
jgi:hypothetical protein